MFQRLTDSVSSGKAQTDFFSLISRLRLEQGTIGGEIGGLSRLEHLELIDFELKIGFSEGFAKLKLLKKILLIPNYKDEVRLISG